MEERHTEEEHLLYIGDACLKITGHVIVRYASRSRPNMDMLTRYIITFLLQAALEKYGT